MTGMKYVSQPISMSRFNRHIHQLKGWLELVLAELGELFSQGEAFVLDGLPLPVCKRVRAGRCHKVRGRAYCGGLCCQARCTNAGFAIKVLAALLGNLVTSN